MPYGHIPRILPPDIRKANFSFSPIPLYLFFAYSAYSLKLLLAEDNHIFNKGPKIVDESWFLWRSI
jgi:hypothetical protein